MNMNLHQLIKYALQISRKFYNVKSSGQLMRFFFFLRPMPIQVSRGGGGLKINKNEMSLDFVKLKIGQSKTCQ